MLRVNHQVELDPSEICETFIRSSGPGGQRVNKVATKVELRFEAKKCAKLSDQVKTRLKSIAGSKWSQDGVIIITAEKYRSQSLNRNLAREKLINLIRKAYAKPNNRLKTKPSKAVKARRASEKSRRSQVKALRTTPKVD